MSHLHHFMSTSIGGFHFIYSAFAFDHIPYIIEMFVVKTISSTIIIKFQQLWPLLFEVFLVTIADAMPNENSRTKFICQSFVMWFAVLGAPIRWRALLVWVYPNLFVQSVSILYSLVWLGLARRFYPLLKWVCVCVFVFLCVKFSSIYMALWYLTFPLPTI